jgi:HD-GYP domain-containing protein (c-di-GMP phosphodiesterase class II)
MALRAALLTPTTQSLAATNADPADEGQAIPLAFFMAIMGAVEAREPMATGRSRQIALHAVATARALMLPGDAVDAIRIGALLANIGMLNVPEAILHKTESLSADEVATIRHHPVLGADILAAVPQLRHVLPLVLHHHEDWHGAGYPHGLAGEAIPLGARIIRVVETYDALTTPRPYRAAFSPEDALQLLANGSGQEFDPRVVTAFTTRMRRNPVVRDEVLDRWDDLQRQARVWRMVANVEGL